MTGVKKYIIKNYKWICLILALLALIPFLYISIYSRPSADDYSYSRRIIGLVRSDDCNFFTLLKAAVKVDIEAWKKYDGPFISQIIMTLQPGIWGEKYYCLGAIWLIFLTVLSLFGMFWNLLTMINVFEKKSGILANSLIMAYSFSAFLLSGLPSIVDGVYWFDGAWNYLPFFFLSLFTVSLTLKYILSDKSKISGIIVTSILAFISCGGNYIVTYCMVILMFSVAVLAFVRKRSGFIFPFITSLMGFALEFFAPGRMSRTGEDMVQNSLMGTVVGTLKQTYIYICEWINVQFVLAILIVVILALMFLPKTMKALMKINPLYLFLYTFLFIAALFLLPCYAVPGDAMAGRILNIIWMMFNILSLLSFGYLACWLQNRDVLRNTAKEENKWVLFLIMLIALVGIYWNTNSNAFAATREILDGTAKEFARTNDVRYEMMLTAAQGDELECEPLAYSKILFFDDLDTDPKDWKNVAWRDYYGIGMHVVK